MYAVSYRAMIQTVTGRKYSAKTRSFKAVKFGLVTTFCRPLSSVEAVINQLANMVQTNKVQASQGCYNTEGIILKLHV